MHKYYSEPFGDSSQIPSFLLAKYSKSKIKIVLTGDGGDEIAGGYNRYLYFKEYLNLFNKNILFVILLKLIIPALYNLNKIMKLDFLNIWNLNSKLRKIKSIANIKKRFETWKLTQLDQMAKLKLKGKIENIDKAGLSEILGG